jgi:hypothetical protein
MLTFLQLMQEDGDIDLPPNNNFCMVVQGRNQNQIMIFSCKPWASTNSNSTLPKQIEGGKFLDSPSVANADEPPAPRELLEELVETVLPVDHLDTVCRAPEISNEWWSQLASGSSPHRKALASLLLLTVWEIWNERNAKVFKNKSSPTFVIIEKIKCEARLWVYAGARNLGSIMPGE